MRGAELLSKKITMMFNGLAFEDKPFDEKKCETCQYKKIQVDDYYLTYKDSAGHIYIDVNKIPPVWAQHVERKRAHCYMFRTPPTIDCSCHKS